MQIFSFTPSIVNRSPSERMDNIVHIRKIIDQKIWLIFCQLVVTPRAGRDGDSARAKRLATGDIARGVANYVDLGCGEFAAMLSFARVRANLPSRFRS